METISLETKYIKEYINDTINDSSLSPSIVNYAKFHHNTNYCDAPLICKHGILTMMDLNKLGIKNFSDSFLHLMDDIESHANGNDGVSLSIVGLTDIYPNEDEYNPFMPFFVDFLVSDEVKAGRCSTHYGNEFVSRTSIGVDKLRSVDIRLLELISSIKPDNTKSIKDVIEKYNHLKEIALAIKEMQLDIPLREMSSRNNTSIDIDKISKQPKLILKP